MTKTKIKQQSEIAIVGMSAILPGSEDITGFWANILAKQDEIKEVPTSHWLVDDYYDPDPNARDKTYGKKGAFLPDVEFDPMVFGMLPSQLESTDTGQLLAMMVAKQVLEDAYNGQFKSADKSKISVILGTTGSTELILEMASRMERPKWVKALREEGLDEERVNSVCDRISAQYVEWQESSFPGLLANVVAGRIAHKLDLGGTNFGPTLTVAEIHAHCPHAVVHGQLAPFTYSRNEEANIVAEFLRDLDQAREKRGLQFTTAGSINNGSRLSGMRLVMAAIQRHGRYA